MRTKKTIRTSFASSNKNPRQAIKERERTYKFIDAKRKNVYKYAVCVVYVNMPINFMEDISYRENVFFFVFASFQCSISHNVIDVA